MKTAVFYAIATVASLGAIAAEALYSRRKQKGWYEAKDVATNVNIGAGNMLSGLVLALVVAAGYAVLFGHRIGDASARLPGWASFLLAVVFADFLQYWNHRLSHRMNLLWAGHVTHHSSSHFNLSTGIRINWLYRGYAWMLYAPMPLLGFSFESFVAAQAVIGTYNLFMHTRLAVPFGPLEYLLVSPASHRLHHSAEPRHFGNYGAALIVWDRLFGTYRELAPNEALPEFGIGRSLGTNPIRLNFHYFVELARVAKQERRSFFVLLFETTDRMPALAAVNPTVAKSETHALVVGGLALVTVVTLTVQAAVSADPISAPSLFAIATALLLITVFGVVLEDRTRNDDPVSEAKPQRPQKRGGRITMIVIAALAIAGAAVATRFRGKAVTVTPVVRGKAIEAVYASGAVEASDRVLLRAKTGGTIELLVREGTTVHKGDLLARIANAGLRYDLERGRADLSAASTMASDDSPQVHALEAQAKEVQAELTVAKQDLARVDALARSSAAPQADIDRAQAKVAHLEAALAANEARQRALRIDLSTNVARQGAQVRSLASRADDAEVRSPIDGVVLGRQAASGDTVTANQPLLQIGDVSHLELELHVDEADIARISDGRNGAAASEAVVRLYAFPAKTFGGTVSEIYPDSNRARRAYLTKVRLKEPPPELRSGMTAEVNIIASKNDSALLVPASAERGGKVWLVEDGLARSRAVVLGIRDLASVEIKSGLSEGDRVVLDPPADLREGDRLRQTARDPSATQVSPPAQASLR